MFMSIMNLMCYTLETSYFNALIHRDANGTIGSGLTRNDMRREASRCRQNIRNKTAQIGIHIGSMHCVEWVRIDNPYLIIIYIFIIYNKTN